MKKEGFEKTFGEKDSQFVKWFSELDKSSGRVAGGKGANLAEIYNLGIPVPPGFVVTAQAYEYFIEKAGIKEKIKELLDRIDYENTAELDEITKQIRVFIEDSEFPKAMEEEVIDAYENLDTKNLDMTESGTAMDILRTGSEPVFVAVRSSATAEDLEGASFAGQQETFLNVKGNKELIKNIKKCFASLFTSRATYYRNKKGFKHEDVQLAVVVQKMVNSDKSGVVFSKDPSYKNNNTIIEAVWGLGEGIVSGLITPDNYVISEAGKIIEKKIENKKIALTRDSSGGKLSVKLKESLAKSQVLKESEIIRLFDFAKTLEDHYKKPQDIEFAIEGDDVFIVQTRPITTIENRVVSADIKEMKGEAILSGISASPGIAVGTVKIIEDLEDLDKIRTGDILVTKMTNPDMVVTMQKSTGIITDEGGLTAHAAIVSREMGIPCIVGTGDATTRLKDGEVITLDAYAGKVYKGRVAQETKQEVLPVTISTKTQIKLIVDLPHFAERAAKTGLKKVGLLRIEGIIAESGKHPNFFLKQNKLKEYEELIFNGINKISIPFEEIWVRTSDIRTDEFQNLEGAPKEKEANPMLGFHGIRFGLKNKELLKAEIRAVQRVAEKNKNMGLMIPQLISLEELQEFKKLLKEISTKQIKVGVMIETPAAVQIIKDLCEEGIDFISFGTNDLTQYILAIDRGNKDLQDIYSEMHPAVLYQLEYVIRVCKRYNIETSICGQAGSKKEMVKFLVEKGISSITVNADAAKTISETIKEVEGTVKVGTDEEPRHYEKVKEQEKVEEKPLEEIKKEVIEKQIEELPKEESSGVLDIIEENIEDAEEGVEDLLKEVVGEEEETFYNPTYKESKEKDELPEPVIEKAENKKGKFFDIF